MVTSVTGLRERRTGDAEVQPGHAFNQGSWAASREPPEMSRAAGRRPGLSPLLPLRLLLLLACCARICLGAPILPKGSQPKPELQLWNEIHDTCSPFLSVGSQTQVSSALRELCLTMMKTVPKPKEQNEKEKAKRFLFHYSKTQKLGNSNVVSSVVHPLLQLIPKLHERRMKRFKVDEEFQSPLAGRSRGYFLFRPRNGKRSTGFI